MAFRSAIFWLATVTCMACASTAPPAAGGNATEVKPSAAGDPFTLVEAAVEGDSLVTTVRYGGGFRDHVFRLESAGAATKSLPRQQSLRIFHGADGDMGRALIEDRRAFDLTPFRDPSQPRVMLRIAGWEGLIEYSYAD